MLYLASQGKTFLLCQNSVSTKNSSPAQSFIFNSKIPKHIIPTAQSNVDTHTYTTVQECIDGYELVDVIQTNNSCNHVNPSLAKPTNKAPPES